MKIVNLWLIPGLIYATGRSPTYRCLLFAQKLTFVCVRACACVRCPLSAESGLMQCNKHRGIQSTVSQQSWHLRKAGEFDRLENSRGAIEEYRFKLS